MARPLCIYHGNCADGFGAAWVVRRALGDNVEFVPGVYGFPNPEHIEGRDIIMVDFSYKRPVLDKMAMRAIRLTCSIASMNITRFIFLLVLLLNSSR